MARPALRTTPNLQDQSPRGTDFERHHSVVDLNEDARSLRRGFTIVELLIVVVVIAILAAITIVSYNGISNRAKNSAAASSAEQAAKKVMAYAITNADQFPATLAEAGISDGSATYQYRVDNSANPKTFCLTSTTSNVSYFVSNAALSPSVGACAGHGANGATVVTNIVTNPSVEISTAGWGGGNGGASVTTSSARAFSGTQSLLWQAPPTPVADSGAQYPLSSLTVGQIYTASAYVFQIGTVGSGLVIGAYQGGWTRSTPVLTTGTWTRISVTFTATQINAILFVGSVNAPTSSSQFSVDALQVVTGSSNSPYADGSSPGWAWTGSPHNSTSTGPAL